uniref:Uncharacterized protein n=1 Tax=Rhizophora mucronata TaxID=61149 RepID=A0A2P2PIQ8_RHIMU
MSTRTVEPKIVKLCKVEKVKGDVNN